MAVMLRHMKTSETNKELARKCGFQDTVGSEKSGAGSEDDIGALAARDPLRITEDMVKRAERPELSDPVWALLKTKRKKSIVRVLPTMPQYSYRHTCP